MAEPGITPRRPNRPVDPPSPRAPARRPRARIGRAGSRAGQRLGLVGRTVGTGRVGVVDGLVSGCWVLPLLNSMTTTPPLMVRPLGLVSAAVPAGQLESTVGPTETSKPAPSRRSLAW